MNFHRRIQIALCFAAAFLAPAMAQNKITSAQALLGEWWTPGFNARVRIEPCTVATPQVVCGRIVWAWDETPPDIADKTPLVGKKVIEAMRLDPDAAKTGAQPVWSGGKLYNPEDGRDYKGSVTLVSATQLRVDGCVLFICKSQVWRRMDSERSPPVAPLEPTAR